MSTNAYIALDCGGEYEAVYLHWDGMPDTAGITLEKNYDEKQKVQDLINLGDLSVLGATSADCVAYHRDRNENWSAVQTMFLENLNGLQEIVGSDYLYIFDAGTWQAFRGQDQIVIPKVRK